MAEKRKAIGPKKRFEIFKRDLFTCQYCGRTPPQVVLEVDHVVPVVEGGTNTEVNLLTSCWECNSGKGGTSLEQITQPIEQRLEIAKEKKKQVKAFEAWQIKQREEHDRNAGNIGEYFLVTIWGDEYKGRTVDDDKQRSIRRFLKDMSTTDLMEAIDITAGLCRNASYEQTFRYLCGVCWRRIKGERLP